MKSNQMLRVAIIDDGCYRGIIPNGKNWTVKDSKIEPADNATRICEDSHASNCVKIIQKYSDCSRVEWHDIQALNWWEGSGNLADFVCALDFCRELDIDILHLSIGTTYPMDFPSVKEAIDKLLAQNVVVIAASSNRGTLTYPANLPGVIGVINDPGLKDNHFLPHYDGVTGIDFRASSRHLLRRDNKLYLTPLSNSYAAPVLTAAAIREKAVSPDLGYKEIIERFFGKETSKRKLQLVRQSQQMLVTRNISAECPIVAISGFPPKETLFLMKKLQNRFADEEYFAMGATDFPNSSDFISIPQGCQISSWIQQIINFAVPSVLLFGLSGCFENQDLPKIDYSISGLKLKFQLSDLEKNRKIDILFEDIKHRLS